MNKIRYKIIKDKNSLFFIIPNIQNFTIESLILFNEEKKVKIIYDIGKSLTINNLNEKEIFLLDNNDNNKISILEYDKKNEDLLRSYDVNLQKMQIH